jgi:hypothetical protein
MNIKQQIGESKLIAGYATALDLDYNKVHGVMRKLLQAKSIDDRIYALQFLLDLATNTDKAGE